MNKGRLGATILVGTLTVLYPVIVYFGIQVVPMGSLLLILGVALLGRLLLGGGLKTSTGLGVGIALLFCLLVWLSGSTTGLLYYPVVINLTMLLIFAASLVRPPSAIEQLARLSEPDLPDSGVTYTRRVTWVWCCFFVINGSIAWYTAADGNMEIWALYNGLIAYVAMGALFGVEWLIRRRVRAKQANLS